MNNPSEHPEGPQLLYPVTWPVAESLVRLIPQYRNIDSIELTRVQLVRIKSLARFVRSTRLQFAEAVINQMQAEAVELFRPIAIIHDGKKRVVMPPVVEAHGDSYILMDGTHRIWLARKALMESVYVIRVNDVKLALPSEPFPWQGVTEREDYYTTEENLVNLDRSLFRPVTTTFNGPQTLL